MNLKPNRHRLRAAALTFLCGLTLNWALRPATPESRPALSGETTQTTPPTRTEQVLDWAASPKGEEWKHRMNGVMLRLDYAALSPQLLAEAKVEPLPSGRVLVAADDTLYMLDAGGEKLWEHREEQPIFDFAHVAATGLVYATAGDGNLLILEAWTGRLLLRETRNGRAGFGQTLAYGKDMCLVADDNSGYRSSEDFIPPMSDGVTAWRGTKMLWHQTLPPDSELRVAGGRIFAVTKTSERVLVKEITPPAAPRLSRRRT